MSVAANALDSSDDLDPEEDEENETKDASKKKNKRRKGIICLKFTEKMYEMKMQDQRFTCLFFSQKAVRAVMAGSIQWIFG